MSLPNAQSLIICGIYIGGFKVPDLSNPSIGHFSRLILSGFYFDVVTPLGSIATLLNENGYHSVICDGYNGVSVLPLKLAAVRAGIGWQGKNSLLITKEYGSFLALGGIITDAPLERDNVIPMEDRCGNCVACRNACPANALEKPYKLNVDKCLSNLLENEPLSEETRLVMGNRVLECDSCQLACPWNQKHLRVASEKPNSQWLMVNRYGNLDEFFKLSNLIRLSEEDFNKYLGKFLAGVDYKIFRRNVIAAIMNSQDAENLSNDSGRIGET